MEQRITLLSDTACYFPFTIARILQLFLLNTNHIQVKKVSLMVLSSPLKSNINDNEFHISNYAEVNF